MQAIRARVTEPVTYQAFQYFITHAPWQADAVWRRLLAMLPERRGAWVLGGLSYLPAEWLTEERCAAARIPAPVRFQETWRQGWTVRSGAVRPSDSCARAVDTVSSDPGDVPEIFNGYFIDSASGSVSVKLRHSPRVRGT